MASRVNTRFVVLLTVGVIALLGMLALAYSIAFKSASDLAERGDQFLAAGDLKQAERAYSKAVNKDTTNMEYTDKWISTLEMLVPETETEYRDRYYGDYISAIRQSATVQGNNIEALDRYLNIGYELLDTEYTRAGADRLIEQTNTALKNFEGGVGEAADWERLKRYRGIAITEIAKRDGVLAEGQIDLGIDDLERAIETDPSDVEARINLLRLKSLKVNREASSGDLDARIQVLRENLDEVNSYLTSDPNNAKMQIQRVLMQLDIGRGSVDPKLPPAQRVEQLTKVFDQYRQELGAIANRLTGEDVSQLDMQTIELFAILEQTIDSQSRYALTRRLLDSIIQQQPENAQLLYFAGKLAHEAGDFDEAYGWFERVGGLSAKPLSNEGLRQYSIKRQALLEQSEIRIQQATQASDPQVKAAKLEEAKAIRGRFATAVSEDSLSLMLLDGKLAQAEDKTAEALRLFKRFNEQTQRNNPEGLWYEGLIASQLGQYGIARDALKQMIPLENSNRKLLAMLTLAQIDERLQDYDSAATQYQNVLQLSPGLQPAVDGLANINRVLNPELNDDPVIAAIFTARRMRMGTQNNPGDYAGAVQYLRESVVKFDHDPRIARELASLLLDSNDVEGARTLVTTALQKNPDDEVLKSMLTAMESGSPDEILVAMIRGSDRDELEKLLAIANVASMRDMGSLFDDTVRQLNEMAPDDKRVLEVTFVQALRRGDVDRAKSIAQNPAMTPLEVLTYKARIASSQNDTNTAIDLLKQATASGSADASTFQMLAVLQRETGRMNDSIASFERALSIRPDNGDTIREYLITLVRMGQYDEALQTARRLQRYGTNDPVFMNLWLNLESQFGGPTGRNFATRQRERMLELNPTDTDNSFQLARMYIQAKNWEASRQLIDRLRASNDQLEFAQLDATWYADQGTVDNKNGLLLANEVFTKYIDSLPAPVGPEPYIASSEFMLARGRPDMALVAANEAVKRQSPDTMMGSKLLGDLNMRINSFTDAAKAYQEVIAAGADDENQSVRARLIESLVRLGRFQEAQAAYDQFPAAKKNEMITLLQGADIASGLEQTKKAREMLDQAVAANPNEPLVYIKRAELMIGDETLVNDMLSDLGRAIDLDPESWRAYRVRAAGLFAVGRREEALNDLKTTVRLNPGLDRSVYAVLNELLTQPNRAGEAADVARDVIALRPDDANLMARIGGLFASRKDWDYAAEFYGMAWDKRHGIGDGATYIDTLVRKQPPDAAKANEVINALAAMVGNINDNSGLLAAQALVLQARGRDDFAQQQITKAFDLSVNNDSDLLNWANNISRYFEGRPVTEHVAYLDTLRRRNTNPEVGYWLDYFILQRLLREGTISDRAQSLITALKGAQIPNPIAARAFRIEGTTLFNEGRYEEAATVWKEGLKRFSDDWEMNNNLAYTLSSKLGRSEEALPYAENALSKNTVISEPYETLAGIYIALGKFDEAEQMIETGSGLINSIPARINMLLTSGRLALKRDNIADARSKISDARSTLRSAPEAYPELEAEIDAFEQDVNTGGN